MAGPPYFVKSHVAPSNEAGTIAFETPRLIVRRHAPSDAAGLAAAANFPSIGCQIRDGFPSPYTLADAEAFLARPKPTDGSALFPTHLGIFLKPESLDSTDGMGSRLIGGIGLIGSTNVNFRTWELGYWLTPDVWRKGYGLEVVRAMVRFAFTTWTELNRIEAVPFSTNIASRDLLLKAGFVEEGVKRGSVFKSGKLQDEHIFSILRSDLEKPCN